MQDADTTLGSVELIDHMGGDIDVANAARVSMNKEVDVFGESDEKLIEYLAKADHWSPFSHCIVKLRIKMPIFTARQWFKSSVGVARNEVSRRYVDEEPTFYVPGYWRKRPDKNIKQGSKDEPVENDGIMSRYQDLVKLCNEFYSLMIANEVAPEMARMILPQSMHTEFIETASLFAYARICKLRLDSHAQKEVKWFAREINKIMSNLYPVSWKALMRKKENA